jgi:hypothetical protein
MLMKQESHKHEAPNTRLSRSSNLRALSPKGRWLGHLKFGGWCFFGARRLVFGLSLALGVWCLEFSSYAYPPGPYNLLYGTVRDQYGTPLNLATARVVLQTPSGVQFAAPIIDGASQPGINYLLKVPLDSGAAPDLYQPNVLLPGASYKLVVVIGAVTNLPIEMGTNYLSLGKWTKTARVDLTLGVDSNGDGIPDAWEYAFLNMLGTNLPLSSLTANSILTPDGLTLRQEYLLGTALFDPGDPLNIIFVGFIGASPMLQFPVVTGRSYTVLASPDLHSWSPVSFNLATEGLGGPTHSFYVAPGVATIQVYLAPPPLGASRQFYRILVQ